jgi:branched-chain amino acid transport system substrate-binding protein
MKTGKISLVVFLAMGLCAILGTPANSQPQEVVIGGIWPLTGPNAPTGVECVQGAKLAMEIVNGKFDLNLPLAKTEGLPNLKGAKLKMLFADHQNIPDKAMGEAERLITQEKVVSLMGCYISGVTAPASQAAERRKIPFLDADAIAPTLIKRGFKYFFRVTQDDEIWFRDFMWNRFIPDVEKKKGGKIRNIAVLHENTLWGVDAARFGMEHAKKQGLNVLTEIAYPARSTSLTSEVQKLKMVERDTHMLLQASYTADGILFMKTFHEMDYNPPMIWNDGGYREPAFLEALGKKSDYILQRDEFSVDMGERKVLVKQVNDLYKQRFGVDLNTNSARNFMGVIALADAINRAGSTNPEAIRQALLATKLPPEQCICSWEGIEFDPNTGQNIKAVSLMLQVHDGKWRLVWPYEVAVKDLVYPLPKWSERK